MAKTTCQKKEKDNVQSVNQNAGQLVFNYNYVQVLC